MTTNQLERGKAGSRIGARKSIGRSAPSANRASRVTIKTVQLEEFMRERAELQERVGQLEKQLGEVASVASTTKLRIPPKIRALVKAYSFYTGRELPATSSKGSSVRAKVDAVGPPAQSIDDPAQQGHAQIVAWTQDGTLVPSKQFASFRGKSPQALHKAVARGELFSFKVNANLYYPAALQNLTDDVLGRLCFALQPLDKIQKLAFVLRKHGALGGLTVAQAVSAGKAARVVELAEAWAIEYGAAA